MYSVMEIVMSDNLYKLAIKIVGEEEMVKKLNKDNVNLMRWNNEIALFFAKDN